MALELPGWLVDILNFLQFEWPKANEDIIWQWRDQWKGLKGTIDGFSAEADAAIAALAGANSGPAMDQVNTFTNSDESNVKHLRDAGNVANALGEGHHWVGVAIVAMKSYVIGELIAIGVTAAMSAGMAVFLFKELIVRALNWAIGEAVGKLLGGA